MHSLAGQVINTAATHIRFVTTPASPAGVLIPIAVFKPAREPRRMPAAIYVCATIRCKKDIGVQYSHRRVALIHVKLQNNLLSLITTGRCLWAGGLCVVKRTRAGIR